MKKVIYLFIVSMLVSGCTYGMIAQRNSNKLLTLNLGQSKQEVLNSMGNPRRNEKYNINGKEIDIFFYRTSWTSDGAETDDEFTPVVFENEKLIGWGRNFYDQTIKFKSEIKQDINIQQNQ